MREEYKIVQIKSVFGQKLLTDAKTGIQFIETASDLNAAGVWFRLIAY